MIDTTHIVMNFGKYKGERIQRIPVSYLLFCVRNQTQQCDAAQAELDRRGTVVPTIEISGHAIDSASLRCRKTWHQHREPSEGLHAWLCKMAQVANDNRREDEDRAEYLGVVWVFDTGGEWPVLKTCWPARRKRNDEANKTPAGVGPGDDPGSAGDRPGSGTT